jgi:uncharacterized SAM-binding protein YcdF (DUF218 family)
MIDFIKATMRPSSVTCLVMLLTPGVLLACVPPVAKWGRRWLVALAVGYWTLSTPVAVRLLARTLTHGYAPIAAASEVEGASAIVLLGAGSINIRAFGQQLPIVTITTGLRAIEAARLYRLIGSPLVIASGGVTRGGAGAAPEAEAMVRALRDLDVPPDRIVSESRSKNTRDEAIEVAGILRARGITRFVLVTSPTHMRRSMTVFEAYGMHPIAAVAPLSGDHSEQGYGLVPSESAIWIGDDFVYEWAARLYYWWNGWLAVPVT